MNLYLNTHTLKRKKKRKKEKETSTFGELKVLSDIGANNAIFTLRLRQQPFPSAVINQE